MDELTDLNEVVEPEEENQEEIVLATVAEVTADGVKITIDGSEEAGEKEYKVNSLQLIKPGDRVKIHKNSGTYLIEYVIGSPMERYPIPPGGSSGQVLKKSSNTNYAVEWGAAPSPTALSNGSYTVTCASNGFLYPSSGNISLGSNNGYWYNCYIKGSMRFGDSSYSPNAIGFFGKTPVSKQTLYSSSTLANVITLLQNYGLA